MTIVGNIAITTRNINVHEGEPGSDIRHLHFRMDVLEWKATAILGEELRMRRGTGEERRVHHPFRVSGKRGPSRI